MNYTIIFEGDTSPVVDSVSDILSQLGFHSYEENSLSARLLESVNLYRRSMGLEVADYIDPAALRAMGIDAEGDELIAVARAAASGKTELECYDICVETIRESQKLGITLTAAAERRQIGSSADNPPPYCVAAAILALLNE